MISPFAPAVRPCLRRVAAAAIMTLAPVIASAGTLPVSGLFADDDEIFLIGFAVTEGETVTATSLGFGGGTAASGSAVASGGFATVLSLFDGTGQLVQLAVGSANTCAGAAVDPATGFRWDACFGAVLAAGNYALALSQDGNLPNGPVLADGFSMTGQADYTGLNYLGASARFVNVDGSQRDGHWALDLTALSVPEPAAWVLFGLGLVGLGMRRSASRARTAPLGP